MTNWSGGSGRRIIGSWLRTGTGGRTWESGWRAAEDSAGDDSLSIELLPFGYGTDLMKVLFLHGWHSVPGGVKPNYLAEHDLEVLNPPLDDDDFGEAVAAAQAEFDKHRPQVVVGSSRGGAVAMNIKSGDAWLVLLCPAWRNWGTRRTVKADTVILHSRADDVIPFADSEELVRNSGLPAWTLVEVGNDHRLADPESLAMMLDACRIKDEEADEEEDLLERDWTGLCYTAALRWADEEEHRDWVVVHGTVLSEKLGKRIEHAWCERGEFIVDLAMPVGARVVKREQYYRVLQPTLCRVYTSDEALRLSSKHKHDGPWDEGEPQNQEAAR